MMWSSACANCPFMTARVNSPQQPATEGESIPPPFIYPGYLGSYLKSPKSVNREQSIHKNTTMNNSG
jgi:hypothetical protein